MSYQPYGSCDPYYPSFGDPSYAISEGAPNGPQYEDAPSQYAPSISSYGDTTVSSKSSKRSTEYSTYFLPGIGISRQVILSRYQLHLGPSATIRPFSYQQREGYMITNPGKPLTQVSRQMSDQKEACADLGRSTEPDRRFEKPEPRVRAKGSQSHGI